MNRLKKRLNVQNKKILVTGASGMLGNHIVRELVKDGHAVKCFVQTGQKSESLKQLGVEIIFGDLLDAESLRTALNGCNRIIHAAACTDIWPYRSESIRRANYIGVINLAEAARAMHIERFVHIGSASSFDHGTREIPGHEGNGFNGWRFGLDYINTKFLSQQLLLDWHKQFAFPVVIINPTFMIGRYDHGPSSGKLLLSFCKGSLPGYAHGGRNFVCASDVACAAVAALTKGRTGECYIAGGENLSYREFFEIASVVIGRPFKLKRIPPVVLRAFARWSSARLEE